MGYGVTNMLGRNGSGNCSALHAMHALACLATCPTACCAAVVVVVAAGARAGVSLHCESVSAATLAAAITAAQRVHGALQGRQAAPEQ